MSAKMQALLTKVPLTLGDSCFVMDLATEIPATGKMTVSACGSAAVAAHWENWQNNPTHASFKSWKTKKQVITHQVKTPPGYRRDLTKVSPKKGDQSGLYFL